MTISVGQAVELARAAGFGGDALVTIVAIAMAESGLDPSAQGWNGPTAGCPGGSVDRGILQINSCYHAEVSDAQAYDPAAAFRAGFAISGGGASFGPWATYTGGQYRSHVEEVRAAASLGGGGGGGDRALVGTGLNATQLALLAALLVLGLTD